MSYKPYRKKNNRLYVQTMRSEVAKGSNLQIVEILRTGYLCTISYAPIEKMAHISNLVFVKFEKVEE